MELSNNKPELKYVLDCGGVAVSSHHLSTVGADCICNIDMGQLQKDMYQRIYGADKPVWMEDVTKVTLPGMNRFFDSIGKPNVKVGEIDFWIATTSCVEISMVNKKRTMFAAPNLTLIDLPRRIREFQPKVVIVENSSNLFKANMLPLCDSLVWELEHLKGYRYQCAELDAVHYKVPQHRKRGYAILTREEYGDPVWPQPTTTDYASLCLSAVLPNITAFTSGLYRNEPVPANRPCCTITAGGLIRVFEKWLKNARPLTVEEGKLLMTVGKDFNLDGLSYKDAFLLLGNGVPANLMLEIVRTLKEQVLLRGRSGLNNGMVG
jgi:site-specific DNA-cytosine methylase